MIKKGIRHYLAIRILTLFEICIIIFNFIVLIYNGYHLIFLLIVCLLLIICIIMQVILYSFPNGYIEFGENTIIIKSKKINEIIYWEDVKYIYYNSFENIFPCLNHFTIDLCVRINNNLFEVNRELGEIVCSKKEYVNIISNIPQYILDANEFMIYSTIVEKDKNRFNIK